MLGSEAATIKEWRSQNCSWNGVDAECVAKAERIARLKDAVVLNEEGREGGRDKRVV